MALHFTEDGYILDDYLKRSYIDKGALRKMNSDEIDLYDRLRKTNKDVNYLMTELLTIIKALETLKDKNFYYIIVNLRRVVTSLRKQRDYSVAVRHSLNSTIPNPDELKSAKIFATKLETRLTYIRNTIVPANLELTPIKEYLEIKDLKDFIDDIRVHWPDKHQMYAANTGQNNDIEEYVQDILWTVHLAGKDDEYQARLNTYIERENEKLRRKEAQKKQERHDRDISLAKDGMSAFQRMFHKGVRTLQGHNGIKMGQPAVMDVLNNYGRDVYFVLCSYMFHNDCKYRYLGEEDQLVERFKHARIFKDNVEATDVMTQMEKRYPDKVFDVIKMAYS